MFRMAEKLNLIDAFKANTKKNFEDYNDHHIPKPHLISWLNVFMEKSHYFWCAPNFRFDHLKPAIFHLVCDFLFRNHSAAD